MTMADTCTWTKQISGELKGNWQTNCGAVVDLGNKTPLTAKRPGFAGSQERCDYCDRLIVEKTK